VKERTSKKIRRGTYSLSSQLDQRHVRLKKSRILTISRSLDIENGSPSRQKKKDKLSLAVHVWRQNVKAVCLRLNINGLIEVLVKTKKKRYEKLPN